MHRTVSFAYRTYAASSNISIHQHSSPSLTIVLGGSYEEAICGKSIIEQRGSALICPAQLPHSQQFGVRGARKLIVTPDGDLLDYLVSTISFDLAPVGRSTRIERLAAQIDRERLTQDAFSRVAIEGLIWQACAELGRALDGSMVPTAKIVRRARAAIEAVDGELLSVVDLARHLSCHPATLNRAFRKEYGCTPGSYQRELRVKKAAGMIRGTRRPIAEIAACCGFCDQAHLARSFRAVMGCSPSEYRLRA